jgi:hypothetical protein
VARIYISSTYQDLKAFREAVYHVLRQLGHDVVAMEDYVAADARPLEKCLADVASCDAYVGLVGDRYGYVPDEGNPERKSITELEYREAEKQGKKRLVFVYSGPPDRNFADFCTGGGDNGGRVKTFKDELQKQRTVSEFTTPDDLGQKVAVAVTSALPPDAGKKSEPPPIPPDLELLRRSAQNILKLYGAKAIHDTLHEIYLRARVLRSDDPTRIDGRPLLDVAAYCAPRLTTIAAEAAQCKPFLDDSERTKMIDGHGPELERGIGQLRAVAADANGEHRARAVDDFNQRLGIWLSDLDNMLKELADRLDGDEISKAIGRLTEAYAAELVVVERNLRALMADGNPVLSKCKALLQEHHGLQDVQCKFPSLFERLTLEDARAAAGEWRRLKRRLSSARGAWQEFGELPSGGEDWEEDVRDNGGDTWPLVDTCINDVEGFLADTAATNMNAEVVRPLTKLRESVEEHFKIVDEALREGYRLVKTRVGQPLMEIG